MKILSRAGLLAALSLLAVFVCASPAFAQGKADGPAKALQKKAMDEDYLALEFDKAAEKLTKAIALCGADKCVPLLRAQLRRDLGVVQIGSGADKDKGTANFIEALKIEPTLALDPDIKTKELDAAFEAARKKAGSGAAAPAGTGGAAPSGDFTHTPIAGQAVRTPVPIYVEYAGSEQLAKVIARYKGFGMTEFKTIELKKLGTGFGGTIPCVDVGQQGALQYYVQGFNAANDPVATAGDRNNTYKVPIKSKFEGEAPHLPDQPAPTQCADTGDCPPGFPCAKKVETAPTEGGAKPEGEECEESSECKSNSCKANKCTAVEEAGPKRKRIWIGIAGALDLVFLSSAQDVCKLDPMTAIPTNSSGYYCTNTDGSDYPSRSAKGENDSLAPGKAGSVNGGAAIANIRVMLTADYALNDNIMLGARFGFILKTYPGAAGGQDGLLILPIHAEGRFTYLIGKEAISKPFAPYAFGAFGLSQSSAEVDVPVVETAHDGLPGGPKTVQAWAIGGPLFFAVGGGARVAIGPRAALMFAPLKVNFAFGKGSMIPSLQPELGIQVGF